MCFGRATGALLDDEHFFKILDFSGSYNHTHTITSPVHHFHPPAFVWENNYANQSMSQMMMIHAEVFISSQVSKKQIMYCCLSTLNTFALVLFSTA